MTTPETFTTWYERYHVRVLGVCARLLGDYDLAADIAQDVWLQAWAERERYREQGHPLAYLCTLARSRSIDELRRQRRRAAHVGVFPSVPHPSAAQELELAELLAVLAPAVAALPTEPQRTALLLAVRGLRYDEAAAAMGLETVGAYRALLHRARVAMRGSLDER